MLKIEGILSQSRLKTKTCPKPVLFKCLPNNHISGRLILGKILKLTNHTWMVKIPEEVVNILKLYILTVAECLSFNGELFVRG